MGVEQLAALASSSLESSEVPAGQRQSLVSCPLCDAPSDQSKHIRRYAKDHLVRCSGCGFVFSLLIPSAEDYARVYGAYNYAAEDAARTPFSIGKERRLAQSLCRYRQTGKVLDIGAGAGRFLLHFQDMGFEPYATEFSDSLCDYLHARGIRTLPGGLLPKGEPGSFDVVILTEVIEHINNPGPVLANIARLLRPGGCLYLTTPNFASLERMAIGPSWGMLCWPEHITYWTPAHLREAIDRAGLLTVRLTTENISPYRIVQAWRGNRDSAQAISDAAQRLVAGGPLRLLKQGVNAALRAAGLGSGITLVAEAPRPDHSALITPAHGG